MLVEHMDWSCTCMYRWRVCLGEPLPEPGILPVFVQRPVLVNACLCFLVLSGRRSHFCYTRMCLAW